jgi:hypothetical protein
MIVLSVGMPRAGSGWHYNLIQDLMRTAGANSAADIRSRYHLGNILTEVNCNIGVLSMRRLAMVAVPALLGRTFVIKAHSQPTPTSRLMQKVELMRVTYIYRDPRDAMLSAMDYGSRGLANGRPNAFSDLVSFEPALEFILGYVHIWAKWVREVDVLVSRYEDLANDYEAETKRLAEYLHVDFEKSEVKEVVERYRPERAEGRQGTHFFKGRIGRFREAFTSAQQETLAQQFGPYLVQMGYAL